MKNDSTLSLPFGESRSFIVRQAMRRQPSAANRLCVSDASFSLD